MRQFIAAFLFFSLLILGIDGCQHPRVTQVKPGPPVKPPEATLPVEIPPVSAPIETAFALKYQDIRIGTGAVAEPNKQYKVHYTGWLAADGHKFDSSYDHKTPVIGADGNPELDADGNPKMNEGQPITFIQGFGRVIPGFDQGFTGMNVGGKRRLFIPWQLAYGARGRPGPNAANPGIPPKADLIFDIELVDMTEMQMPQGHPAMPMRTTPHPLTPGAQPTGGTPATPPASTPATPEPRKPQSN
jgi:peptidylprolyl isomerase